MDFMRVVFVWLSFEPKAIVVCTYTSPTYRPHIKLFNQHMDKNYDYRFVLIRGYWRLHVSRGTWMGNWEQCLPVSRFVLLQVLDVVTLISLFPRQLVKYARAGSPLEDNCLHRSSLSLFFGEIRKLGRSKEIIMILYIQLNTVVWVEDLR